MNIEINYSLKNHNTFGMDVKCALYAEWETLEDLEWILQYPQAVHLMEQERAAGRPPFWVIGEGSNLLFKGDYPGLVLHCANKGISIATNEIEEYPLDWLGPEQYCMLCVQAGTHWDDVCEWCAQRDLYGIENLSLIPGEAGAAAVQNIGAYGVEIGDVIELVNCYDIEAQSVVTLSQSDMQYGYRQSFLKQPENKGRYIVLDVMIRVQHTPKLNLSYKGLQDTLNTLAPSHLNTSLTPASVRTAIIAIRNSKLPDPVKIGNAGSFFKNPVITIGQYNQCCPDAPKYPVSDEYVKVPAGWLIEQCGWKGKRIGNCGVFDKQALVLVNHGGATPDELVSLCTQIIDSVRQRFNITIEPEVNII